MKGDPKVIEQLQIILKNELTAVNQYFLHARILKNWGLYRLAKKEYDESIGEMKHADQLIERILFLEALPNLQDLGKINIGQGVVEVLRLDLDSERANQGCLKQAISVCETAQDYVSRELLEGIMEETEEHIDWLETQLDLVDRVGETPYTQEQMFGGDDG